MIQIVYRSKEYWNKIAKSLKFKPNKPETIILNILNKFFPNEWEYVGDYKFWVNGNNPDFVNYNKKKIIEFFGNYWHSKK